MKIEMGMGGETEFNFYPWNRDLDRKRVDVIKALITKFGYAPDKPISVDEDSFVVDGQHRYMAATELCVPFTFIRTQARNPQEVISVQTGGKPWGAGDFLHYYASIGNPEYVKLDEYLRNNTLQLFSFLHAGSYRRNVFNSGQFMYPLPDDPVWLVFRAIRWLSKYVDWSGNRFSVGGLRALVNMDGYNPTVFEERIEGFYSLLGKCHNVETYYEMYLRVYNYKARANRIGSMK